MREELDPATKDGPTRTEHFDVVIVGAGIAGIDAAHRLRTECPEIRFTVLEGRSAIGGTWDLFRYPGVRSDSDMFTLGYPFRPWQGERSIADGPAILAYIRETAEELGVDQLVRFEHRVVNAGWDSKRARWNLELAGRPGITCTFLYLCCGYFNYERGYTPSFPGQDLYEGVVVHPQFWPESLDLTGRRVVVIGSGATAVSLIPAIADRAAHVTMLQRSPGYMMSRPTGGGTSGAFRGLLPPSWASTLDRWRNVGLALAFYQLCRRAPGFARRRLLDMVRHELPEGYPVDVDFAPHYSPWDERLCIVPDGDLFAAIREGRVSVVTAGVQALTETGVRLDSGQELSADVIVTATGLELLAFGGIRLTVDSRPIDPGATFIYRGFMLGGVPNLAVCMGYTNASWTLRADLTSRRLCRLLNHMRRRGCAIAEPPTPDGSTPALPLLNLSSGYVRRAHARMPKRSDRGGWKVRQNYPLDVVAARLRSAAAGLRLSKRPARVARVGDDSNQTRTNESSVPNALAT